MSNRLMIRLLPLSCAFVAIAAHADSGVGVDTWRANKLDPTGGQKSEPCDEDGTSWLSPLQHRTPTGNLYDCPDDPPLARAIGDWLYYGVLQVGYTGIGDQPFALWNRYSDWKNNKAVLGLFDMHFERPEDGSYAEVRGSRISDEDQYYQAVYGKVGAYKVEAFMREMPNILSTDAKSIWNGVGTNNLTLPSALTPGESTPAQVAAYSAGLPYQTLKVTRNKQGINLSAWLTPNWTAYFDVTDEQRKGDRPYGGPFGESWIPPGGAILETVKPINDSTINLNTGLRYVDSVWRADIGFSGSFYRDKYIGYSFQQPFLEPSVAPAGQTVVPVTVGQMSMEPDNDYYNLHGELTRVMPMNGELSFTFSDVLMSQHDQLIPPTNCQGFLGWGVPANGTTFTMADLGPQNPNLFNCSLWNTPAALSQPNADVTMRNTLAELKLTLQPASSVTVNGGLKYYRQKYDNNYLAYNPQTGAYGYIGENGAFQTTLGVPLSYAGPFPTSGILVAGRVSPYILSMDEYNGYVGANWKISEHDTLGFTYNYDDYRPTSRERSSVDDNSIKLNFIDKTLDWLTFRANYTYLRQSGDLYTAEGVYDYAFMYSLPSFLQAYPGYVNGPDTVAALRKYDIANRAENKIDLMATIAPRDDLTISASFRGDWNVYNGVLVGRQGYSTLSAQISTEWTPTPTDSFSAYVGYDHSTLHLSSVAGYPGSSNTPTCADLGCSFYPDADRWWESDIERNWSAGLTALHRINNVTFDLSWNYIYSRGDMPYQAASANALVYPDEYATMGTGMPPTSYRVNSVTFGATIAINEYVSLRLFDNYEIGRINDWHYYGMDESYVVPNQNTLYTDGGPQSYRQNMIGVFLNLRL